jgi:hypothetical protein
MREQGHAAPRERFPERTVFDQAIDPELHIVRA